MTWLLRMLSTGAGARRLELVLAFCMLPAALLCAQSPAGGVIDGAVTTQSRTVPLAGAVVVLRRGDQQVATQLAGTDGSFRFDHLPDGRYEVAASLDGFNTTTVPAVINGQNTASLSLDLPITNMSEHVEVVAPVTVVPATGTLSGSDTVNGKEIDQMTSGGGFQSALRLLASVIEVPGGVSIKGGRPSQAGVQIGAEHAGRSGHRARRSRAARRCDRFGGGAAESVRGRVRPILVGARRDPDAPRRRRSGTRGLNNLDPGVPHKRAADPFNINGIAVLRPATSRPAGRSSRTGCSSSRRRSTATAATTCRAAPRTSSKTRQWFSSFTRVDANLSPQAFADRRPAALFPSITDRDARHVHAAGRDGRRAQPA